MTNSSPKSVTPLVLEPGPSRRVRLITLAGFLLALLSVAALPLPLSLLVPGLLFLVAAFAHAWRHHHALSGHPVTVRLDSDGNWHWQQGEASEPVQLLGDSYHVPFLVILNFKPQGRPRPVRSLLLTTDNIHADTFRRLRVHLKWQAGLNTNAQFDAEAK
jgi:hypothetical protein